MKKWQLLGAVLAVSAPVAQAGAEQLAGLTFDQRIVTFDSASPTTIMTSAAISGLMAGDTLSGLDLRSSNGLLYGIAASSGRIYTLTTSGIAALISTSSTLPSGTSYGVDFNPVPDRLRVTSNTDQNLRINVDTGAATVDTPINSTAGSLDIVGAAYTNSVPFGPAPTATMLFGIDSVTDSLMLSSNPNGGVYGLVGALGVNFTNANLIGFDISGRTGMAYLNIDSALYSVNLGTGRASFINTIGSGPLIGLTATGVVPEPATWAMMLAGFAMVGATLRYRRRNTRIVYA
jgi:hypothetical protein